MYELKHYQMPAENSHIYLNQTKEKDSLLTLIYVFYLCILLFVISVILFMPTRKTIIFTDIYRTVARNIAPR